MFENITFSRDIGLTLVTSTVLVSGNNLENYQRNVWSGFKWKVNEEFVKLNVYCLYINPSQYMTASGTSGDMEIMDENI